VKKIQRYLVDSVKEVLLILYVFRPVTRYEILREIRRYGRIPVWRVENCEIETLEEIVRVLHVPKTAEEVFDLMRIRLPPPYDVKYGAALQRALRHQPILAAWGASAVHREDPRGATAPRTPPWTPPRMEGPARPRGPPPGFEHVQHKETVSRERPSRPGWTRPEPRDPPTAAAEVAPEDATRANSTATPGAGRDGDAATARTEFRAPVAAEATTAEETEETTTGLAEVKKSATPTVRHAAGPVGAPSVRPLAALASVEKIPSAPAAPRRRGSQTAEEEDVSPRPGVRSPPAAEARPPSQFVEEPRDRPMPPRWPCVNWPVGAPRARPPAAPVAVEAVRPKEYVQPRADGPIEVPPKRPPAVLVRGREVASSRSTVAGGRDSGFGSVVNGMDREEARAKFVRKLCAQDEYARCYAVEAMFLYDHTMHLPGFGKSLLRVLGKPCQPFEKVNAIREGWWAISNGLSVSWYR